MVDPILNNNGSSAEDLSKPRYELLDLLQDASEALSKIKPHGRDYLNQFDRYERDRQHHSERVKTLRKVREEVFNEILRLKQFRACNV